MFAFLNRITSGTSRRSLVNLSEASQVDAHDEHNVGATIYFNRAVDAVIVVRETPDEILQAALVFDLSMSEARDTAWRARQGLNAVTEATVGPMGETPDTPAPADTTTADTSGNRRTRNSGG